MPLCLPSTPHPHHDLAPQSRGALSEPPSREPVLEHFGSDGGVGGGRSSLASERLMNPRIDVSPAVGWEAGSGQRPRILEQWAQQGGAIKVTVYVAGRQVRPDPGYTGFRVLTGSKTGTILILFTLLLEFLDFKAFLVPE